MAALTLSGVVQLTSSASGKLAPSEAMTSGRLSPPRSSVAPWSSRVSASQTVLPRPWAACMKARASKLVESVSPR